MRVTHLGYFIFGVRRLSASRLGLGEFQLRLSFVEEAWLPQTTCRGACRFNVPADRQSWDRSIPWLGEFRADRPDLTTDR